MTQVVPRPRNFVLYRRVSTQKQGRSGLGLDAQQAAVDAFLAAQGGRVLATYTEVESGKRADNRPQLAAALLRCRQTRATLLVAKLDRLSRNAGFLLTLRDSGVRFIAADMPDANELTVGIMALMAQQEREAIGARTKAALAAARARGTRLGNPRLKPGTARAAKAAREALTTHANVRANELRDVVDDARANGAQSLREIAAHLNGLHIATPRGGEWTATAVKRLLARLASDT
jgi:DNA invertase Pin-like site-specific DNA recombinase